LPETLAAVGAGQLTFPEPSTREPADGDGPERWIREWLARLLKKDTGERYQDAGEVHRDLKAIVAKAEGRPPRARAFVAMPFGPQLDGLWRAIEAICFECEVQAVRVDRAADHENIWDEIRSELRKADIMVAVVSPIPDTAPNPNVMLGIGYMRALGRRVVLVTPNAEALPFDLRTDRAVECTSVDTLDSTFHERLAEALRTLVHRVDRRLGQNPQAATWSA
jgi:nucleoside 2-deoxyribosyltransferase